MTQVTLIVSLKVPDVVAHTAQNTLRRRMRYDALERVHRDDYYELDLDLDDPAEAVAFAEKVVAVTSCFVNPNKHKFQIHAGVPDLAAEPKSVRILVEGLEDGAAAMWSESLGADPRFEGRIRGVRRGTLWTLRFREDFDGDPARVGEEIATATEARKGLLANPHSQRARILAATR